MELDNPDGGRFSRGRNDEEAAVAGDEGAALRPIQFHSGKPLYDQVAKAAGRGVVRGTELIAEACRADDGNPAGSMVDGPTLPGEP